MVTTRTINVVIATVKSVGYRHSRDEVVEAAASIALRDGMAKLTFRRVAEDLGISDRMVVYYLPSKEDLVMAAVEALSVRMQTILERAFGDDRRLPDELLRMAWPVLTKKSADQIFALFLKSSACQQPKLSRMTEFRDRSWTGGFGGCRIGSMPRPSEIDVVVHSVSSPGLTGFFCYVTVTAHESQTRLPVRWV